MHSQRMASIAPIVIGCIDYLAYGTIFIRVMFRPKIKLDGFFPARKAADERCLPGRWCVVCLFFLLFFCVHGTSMSFFDYVAGNSPVQPPVLDETNCLFRKQPTPEFS
jgi:hypothetical protein